jgi:hypothetical protein
MSIEGPYVAAILARLPQPRSTFPRMACPELIKIRRTLARVLSVEDVNDLGRTTGQTERLRTVTPHRLFLAMVSTLADAKVESRTTRGQLRQPGAGEGPLWIDVVTEAGQLVGQATLPVRR